MSIRNISYENCRDASNEEIYKGFMLGFRDYAIPFKYNQRDFLYRFFVINGNAKEYSFIAFHQKQPIGILLGGIYEIHSKKTLRCGGFAIDAAFRGQGIGQGLFQLHKELAKEQRCEQMVLEVLTNNESAIRFYEKQGYTPVYRIHYYECASENFFEENEEGKKENCIKPTTLQTIQKFHRELSDVHFTWKQHPRLLLENPQVHYYRLDENDQTKGMIAITTTGEILLLVTGAEHRRQGVATRLIAHMAQISGAKELTIEFTANPDLAAFVEACGFRERSMSQYEMYCPIPKEDA